MGILIEEKEKDPIEYMDESSIESEEFFELQEDSEFSEEISEPDMWEGRIESASVSWSIPKIKESPLIAAKKKTALSGSTLHYEIIRDVFVAENAIIKVYVFNGLIYLLDTQGKIYIHRRASEQHPSYTEKICIEEANTPCMFKDIHIISESKIIGTSQKARAFYIIEKKDNKYVSREIRPFSYSDRGKVRRVKPCGNNYMIIRGVSVYIFSGETDILIRKIDLFEEVLDAENEGDLLYILTEHRIAKYSTLHGERLSHSEILLYPRSICIVGKYLAVGTRETLSFIEKKDLRIAKDIERAKNATEIKRMFHLNMLLYGNTESSNGFRLMNMKTQQIIKTFPPGKGLSRVGAFSEYKKNILFSEGRRLSILQPTEK
ncbi:hypothetical protein NEFER03_1698 [Nematocida sp. LUAm3]|nr:hypothetical protein NEFER03_1698 [Nematocida sp. LUAm3]KAI5175688.1 hypothetical protein NEFER02_1575 [Nematocida sp. LUAm2]KAI5178594.1 hypothetical protein NEFER01_1730 [Nematocida sp. LUAm1]